MKLSERMQMIPKQKRSYTEGTIECIGDEWIFFDDINEKAFDIRELDNTFEIYRNKTWEKAVFKEKGIIHIKNRLTPLSGGEQVRFTKKIMPFYIELLEEWNDGTFVGFVETLNKCSYSLYDCMYCHNFSSFLTTQTEKSGVNTLLFDNEDQIMSVLHHFFRSDTQTKDRFEFTKSDGTRTIFSSL